MTEKKCDEKVTHEVVGNQRREVFKKAVVVGGMAMSVQQWTKPAVESVILPAHAAVSTLPFVAVVEVVLR